jgi:diguanylate cyclase (GGDEF)-like protein/PAS domain S-box-containing protein
MLVVDKAFNVLRVNDTFLTLLGIDKNEVSGKKCHEISHCSQYLTPDCPLSRMQDGEGKFEHEIKIERYDGTRIPCILTVTAFKDSHGEPIGIIEDLRDITERKLMEKKLRDLSLIDELTSLYNRRGFFALTEQQIRLSQRIKKGLLLLFIDLDRMKWINDNLGHNEGDRALKGVAAVLKDAFRTSDIVARIGGDEFAITAIEAQKESVEIIVNRLQKNLELQNTKEHRDYAITISIGSVYFDPEHPSSIDELLSKADTAMYEQKRSKHIQRL